MDLHEQRFEEMHNAIEARLQGTECAVVYSAYPTEGEEDYPINNLNEVAYRSTCKIANPHDDFWDGRGVGIIGIPAEQQRGGEPCGTDYESDDITDPTWLDLCVIANAVIFATNDFHHIFFEGFEEVSPGVLELYFGS